MVLYSAGKAARHVGSIVNRPTCGGPKKAGLAPSVGAFLQSNYMLIRGVQTQPKYIPGYCGPVNKTIQTQRYGYRATLGPN
jgi:hypothetical protein